MDYVNALILGLVEGITEFLPVSSTGHLILTGEALGFVGERAKVFEIFIQLGAILAVLWIYRATFTRVALRFTRDADARRLLVNLIVAFLPAAVVGLLAHRWIKAHLFGPVTVGAALIAGGVAILLVERLHQRATVERVDQLKTSTALGIGLAQVLSLVPGVSRSGATIMGGLALGLSRPAATEFSFFLAAPVMVAATLFDLLTSRDALTRADAPLFAVGFVAAFVSAVVVVRLFLRYVGRHTFAGFAWYRIALGIAVLAWFGR